MNAPIATNAESSGIHIDRKTLKQLMLRSDLPGLRYLVIWGLLLTASGMLLQYSFMFPWWVSVLPMILYSAILVVPCHSLAHDCSHGTAFRSRWLNELVYWAVSVVYLDPPYLHRYAHARHHTYTWIRGQDVQMTHSPPLTLKGWFVEISNLGQYIFEFSQILRNSVGLYSNEVRGFTPEMELPKLKWEARAFLAIYCGAAYAVFALDAGWIVTFLVIPRLVGGVIQQSYTLIQHAEMTPDDYDVRKSTRSFSTNLFSNFIYLNMSYHVEHHLYPTVPFHAVPKLNEVLKDQLPVPSRGLFRTNVEVLGAVLRRSFGRTPVGGERAV